MKITTKADMLTIQLEGLEKLWALKGHLEIPRSAIMSVDFIAQQPTLQDYKGFLRFPGTALPWRFLAGTYDRGGAREFWYVHMRQPGVLVIALKPGTLRYDKVRISSTAETAQQVADWWQEQK